MQLNEEIAPSRAAVLRAKLLSWIETLILGPLTFGATLVSFFACPCVVLCISCTNLTESDTFSKKLVRLFQECMTSWGMFWISALFFFPLFTICGVFVLAALSIMYPGYAIYRICQGKVPCPDAVINWCKACFSRCKLCCSRMFSCCFCESRSNYRPVDLKIPPPQTPTTSTVENKFEEAAHSTSNVDSSAIEVVVT